MDTRIQELLDRRDAALREEALARGELLRLLSCDSQLLRYVKLDWARLNRDFPPTH